MKIKVVYGIDMRLWHHNLSEDKPDSCSYHDLLTYICKTFEFDDMNEFKITFKDDDDTNTTIASPEDFQFAFLSAKKQEKKSLKLYITDSIQKHAEIKQETEEEKQDVIESNITSSTKNDENGSKNKAIPSAEEIHAFLSDDFVIDLLSDLFVSVFEALQSSQFEIAFIECVQGIVLSNNDKYIKITSNPIWPYFMNELLPKHCDKIERFLVPMMKMNGCINAEMMKQWIPTLLNMMKEQAQNTENACNWNGFGWRGRRGRRHHHHRGHHHGYHGHHHGHHGHRGRGGWRGRGFHGHRGHHRGGWRGCGGFGYNPWFQPSQDNGAPANMQYDAYSYQQQPDIHQGPPPSAPSMGHQENDDEIEAEPFEYTEELVAIMNMGFTNMNKIKKLLNEHKGNKQNVVQELVSSK